MTGLIGVAISTTGDSHRMGFLETCVKAWDRALPMGASLFVTVDGTDLETARVAERLFEWTGSVYRVGQPARTANPRLGVAVNKNTGLELLMNNTRAEHLFLCDDDTWPLFPHSLRKHIEMDSPHSMVCWGESRLVRAKSHGQNAVWLWPRGVLLYTHRSVVETVGGMVEEFGVGGHEHAEWSMRIHNAGLTPEPFISPFSYSTRTSKGASMLWACEDMRKPDETQAQLGARRKAITTIRSSDRDWHQINAVMARQEGSSAYVGYRASENGRASATLCTNVTYQETCAMEPATPRSEK